MHRIFIFALAIALPSTAPAAIWTFVANCGARDQIRSYSYHKASVQADGQNVLVRVKGDYSRDRGARAKEAHILWSFNCADRSFVERSRTEYRGDGTVIATYPSPTGIMGINASSIADKLFAKVCA